MAREVIPIAIRNPKCLEDRIDMHQVHLTIKMKDGEGLVRPGFKCSQCGKYSLVGGYYGTIEEVAILVAREFGYTEESIEKVYEGF